jgi:ferredoxin--NADP+ reductase
MSAFTTESVLAVRHWTDTVFSFTATRSPSLRFESGQFVMIGLEVEGRPLTRAYSIASAPYDDYLEFLSIKVPDGPLTSRLQHIREGDKILVGRKPTGTLIIDNLRPGRILYLLGTGTGLAPFMSLIRDPALYDRFDKVVLVHGCRLVSELAYGDRIMHELPADEYIGEAIRSR